MSKTLAALLFCFCLPNLVGGQEIPLEPGLPRPTPLTRPALKHSLEQVKQRRPRIPLPALTDKDRDELGESVDNYEKRLKYHFLGEGEATRGWRREPDPEMSLPYDFKVQLFWIVSRVNNCHYCIGHQETKLLAAGQSEDQVAALDCDWSGFPESQQVAFEFARTLTTAPASISSSQFERLTKHYSRQQILEMVISVAWNNSINRWKEALAVPQNPDEGGYSRALRGLSPQAAEAFAELPSGSYLTPTSAPFLSIPSTITLDAKPDGEGSLYSRTLRRGKARLTAADAQNIISQAGQRGARLPMASESETRERFAELTKGLDEVPLWMRTLAVFPKEGLRRANAILRSRRFDSLTPLQRARLSWVVGAQDKAGYVMDLAKTEMIAMGAWDSEKDRLTGDWSDYAAKDRVLLNLACDLAHSPVVLSERTVEEAVELNGAATVVQAVAHTVGQAALIRLSEAAALPPESSR